MRSDERRFHDVRIASNKIRDVKVWIDGMQVKGLREVRTRQVMDDVNEVELTFIAGSINKEDPVEE